MLNMEMQISGRRKLQAREILSIFSFSLILVTLLNVFLVTQEPGLGEVLDNSCKAAATCRST